jgi:hypothetical protein
MLHNAGALVKTFSCTFVSVSAAATSIKETSSAVFMTQRHHGPGTGNNVGTGRRLHGLNLWSLFRECLAGLCFELLKVGGGGVNPTH